MTELGLVLLVIVSYALGAVPAGALLARLRGHDLLREGSGKTGTANTLRVLGRPAAALVLVADLLQGFLPVLVARALPWPGPGWAEAAAGLAGAAAIAGHNWSLWVRLATGRWGGGRGLVPALGAGLAVHPAVALAGVVGAVLGLGLTRYMVVGALCALVLGLGTAGALVVAGALPGALLLALAAWAAIILLGFQDTLRRFAAGQEPRLGREP